jgi:hypothetical protein
VSGPGSARITITVTVADDHMEAIEALADRLRAAGMDVDLVLGPVGLITGSAPPGWEAWRDLDGVADVEAQRTVHVPPPGAPQ